MKYILVVVFIFLFSCKKQKKDIQITEKTTTKRYPIKIKNQVFYFNANKEKKDDVIDFIGNYTNDRFNEPNMCVILDGVSDYVEIENTPNLNASNGITVSIWYKPDSYRGNGQNAIIWKGYTEYSKPFGQYFISATGNLYHKSSGSFKFGLSINGKLKHISTNNNTFKWVPNNWYNIVGTYDGQIMKLYVNNELLSKTKIIGNLDNYDTPLLIGKTPFKEFYTSGKFDDLRIFHRALEEDEVSLLYSER